jgi:hypothetical protein
MPSVKKLSLRKGVRALPLIPAASDFTILVIADSLWNETTEGIYKMAVDHFADHPERTVEYYTADTTTTSWSAKTTIGTGSGPYKTVIWNGAIPQSQAVRILSGPEWNAFIEPITPDLIIWGHGKNISAEQMQDARYQAAIEMVRVAKPNAMHAFILEPPNRDDNNMASMVATVQRLVVEYDNDAHLIDCYSACLAAGKPSADYIDNLHPNAQGVDNWIRPQMRAFLKNSTRKGFITPARTLTTITPINTNGDFSDWSAAVPVGYTVVSSPTLAKDTSTKRDGRPYSLRMTGAAGADLRWQADASQMAALAGKFVTISIWEFVEAAMPSTAAAHQLIITDELGTDTKTQARTADAAGPQPHDRWVLTIIRSQRAVGSTPTVIRLINENDTGAGTSTTRIDRIVVAAGVYPRDMVAAAG